MNRIPRGIVLCSGGASILKFLSKHDPRFGKRYTIVGVFSDNPQANGLMFAKTINIPVMALDWKDWKQKKKISGTSLADRQPYFAVLSNLIERWEPDFIILSGFMLIVVDPLLSRFAGRILNVHPADLRICGEDGKPLYRGLNVVRRAMDDGELTCSSVHFITAEVDGGPIVAVSDPLPYEPWDDAEQHQQHMKDACDGPAFMCALETLIDAGWPSVPWNR